MVHTETGDVIDGVLRRYLADGSLNRDEADDIRSIVFLRLVQRSTSDVRSMDDYVAMMVHNAARDVFRARRPRAIVDAEDVTPAADARFIAHETLLALWREIRALPLQQRAALLLHLRDHRGNSAIPLLVFTGTATLDEIGCVLQLDRARLEAIWDQLPLPDADIAVLLHTTRPRVIGLRRAARERLARFLRRRGERQ